MIIKNASPEFLNLGTDDQSARKLYPSTIDVPSHCPKLWFLGKKGTTKPNLTLPEQLSKLYGNETFNVSGKYYNHATLLLTFLYTFYPQVIKDGRVFISKPPIKEIKLSSGNSFYLHTESDYNRLMTEFIINSFELYSIKTNKNKPNKPKAIDTYVHISLV